MFPYLFNGKIAGIELVIPTYGVFLALSFSVAYFLFLSRALSLQIKGKQIETLFILVLLSSIIGSRIFHVFFEEWSFYSKNPAKIFSLWEGGYTFYGALTLSLLTVLFYCKIKKIPLLNILDAASEATPIGLFLGRLGCFFAGCCWGKPFAWGILFTHPESLTPIRGIPLHPTQLYESLTGLVLFFYAKHLWKNRLYPGQIFLNVLTGYSVARFLIEFFRGDDYRGFVIKNVLSYSQTISIAILIAVLIYRSFGLKKLKAS